MKETTVRGGILLVDKPRGITSHDVVSRTRKLADTRRVGHAGTLDPMATGLLILGLNGATRLLTYVVGLDKEYLATIRLGGSTPTDDADSAIDVFADPDRLAAVSGQRVLEAIKPLTGEITQVPSAVSAIKVDGRRAYARVRAGETVELKPRAVTVARFDVLAVRRSESIGGEFGANALMDSEFMDSAFIDIDVRVECSTGTYIRALARDLGVSLGVGGHLTALRRTRVGPFAVADASTLEELDVAATLLAPSDVARTLFPAIELSLQQSIDLSQGKRVDIGETFLTASEAREDGLIAAMAPDGRLVGLVKVNGSMAKSMINFPEEVDAP